MIGFGPEALAVIGTSAYGLVQIVKTIAALGDRQKVAASVVVASALVVLYAFSNALLTPANAFSLVVAAIAVSQVAAGINSTAKALADNDKSDTN